MQWYDISDSHVSPSSEAQALNARRGAYLLFYQLAADKGGENSSSSDVNADKTESEANLEDGDEDDQESDLEEPNEA